MNYLLGIDVGTSATKTVLFDENGRVTASASQEYPLYQPENGWAEQRPEDWADAVLNTIKEVISKSGAGKDDVKGIGISGQMHGLVMLDERSDPSIYYMVRPEDRSRGRGHVKDHAQGRMDPDYCKSAADRLDCCKDPLGTEE